MTERLQGPAAFGGQMARYLCLFAWGRQDLSRWMAPWQQRRAAGLLTENLEGHIRLADLAYECRLSVSHFARSFKRSFGTSVHRYIISLRIAKAKSLLSNSRLPFPTWRDNQVFPTMHPSVEPSRLPSVHLRITGEEPSTNAASISNRAPEPLSLSSRGTRWPCEP